MQFLFRRFPPSYLTWAIFLVIGVRVSVLEGASPVARQEVLVSESPNYRSRKSVLIFETLTINFPRKVEGSRGWVRIVLPRLRVPVRDALREISAILLRREERGRKGLGDRAAPSSASPSSSSSRNRESRRGDTDRGREGGASVERKSSRSEVNFAITCSKACDSVSASVVAVISTAGRCAGGIDFEPIVEEVAGRLSWMMAVVVRVGTGLSSRIVSCAVPYDSFVGELVLVELARLTAVAVKAEALAVGGFRIAGSKPSNPAMKKKSANAATIISPFSPPSNVTGTVFEVVDKFPSDRRRA